MGSLSLFSATTKLVLVLVVAENKDKLPSGKIVDDILWDSGVVFELGGKKTQYKDSVISIYR